MLSDVAPSVCLDSLDTNQQPKQDQSGYLTDYSPKDRPWDVHRLQTEEVAKIFESGLPHHQRQADRMRTCSQDLEFGWVIESIETGETKLKLKSSRFCRVRTCPVCQWRRALMWVSRFYHAFPRIYADHPDLRYILLTLTVKNCPVRDLKETVSEMNSAWDRMTKRKIWPAVGSIRSLEITRSKDGTAHPHFHCLLAVKPGYFKGKNYLSTAKWASLWQSVLRVDYTPICDARTVKPLDLSKSKGKTIWRDNPDQEDFELGLDEVRISVNHEVWDHRDRQPEPLQPTKMELLLSAITEVIKYAVKPSDMLADPDWLLVLSDQLKNQRAVALGGIMREYLSSEEPENLVIEDSDSLPDNPGGFHFGWRETPSQARYRKKS